MILKITPSLKKKFFLTFQTINFHIKMLLSRLKNMNSSMHYPEFTLPTILNTLFFIL